MNIFDTMAGGLNQGWTNTTSWWNDIFKPAVSSAVGIISPVTSAIQQTGSYVSSFFPTQQKTVLSPSIVSNQTYKLPTSQIKTPAVAGWATRLKNAFFGQSKTLQNEKDAPSLWEKIQSAWVKKEVGGKAIDTVFNVLQQGATLGFNLLSDRFLKNPQGRIEPATNAPPTTPAPSLWDILSGGGSTQPVQSYGTGFAPYYPIPATGSPTPAVAQSSTPQMNWTPIIVIGGLLAVVMLSRRTV